MLKNTYQSNSDITLRFLQCGRQTVDTTYRVYGLVKLRHIVRLIEITNLEANPRFSKMSKITEDLIESLETTPNRFWVKSKGLVLAASSYKELDGDRFEVTFQEPEFEGVIDGGHNLLAIGNYFLTMVLEHYGTDADLKELRKAKRWGEFKSLFLNHSKLIEDFLEKNENDAELSIQVSVELILPKTPSNELDINDFDDLLPEVQDSRNNNASLKQETKSNKVGLFDALKKSIPANIVERIEWKSNQEGGKVKAADVIALAWIPLSRLSLEIADEDGVIQRPNPTSIYSSKGELVNRFDRFMSSDMVTTDDIPAELKSNPVRSALELAGDLPELYDLITEKFPAAYNEKGGRFGAIAAVSKMNTKKGKKLTKYTEKAVDFRCPEGFITPLVYGLKSLMKLDGNGEVSWITDPAIFLTTHLPAITEGFMDVIKENNMDPQKVGKSSLAYEHVLNAFELAWLRSSK